MSVNVDSYQAALGEEEKKKRKKASAPNSLAPYDEFVQNSTETIKPSETGELSTYDNQKNRALYNQYIRESEINTQKQTALQKNEQEKQDALREEAILAEKARSYLGKKLALSGSASSGAAESSMLDLYSQQINSRANTRKAYDSKESDIMLEYDAQINDAKGTTNTAIAEIEADEREYTKKKQDEAYNQELINIEQKFQDARGANAKISKEQYNELKEYAESIKSKIGYENSESLDTVMSGYKLNIRDETAWDAALSGEGADISNFKILPGYHGQLSVNDGSKIIVGDTHLTVEEFIRRADISGGDGLNSGETGWFGSEKTDSKQIADAFRKGQIEEGTIFDTDAGEGEKYWIYYNGRVHRIGII